MAVKVLLTGGSGGLGQYVHRALVASGAHVHAPTHFEMPVQDEAKVRRRIDYDRPDVVVHLAALANVTLCQEDSAFVAEINTIGTFNVAKACAAVGSRLVYMSTDAVFAAHRTLPSPSSFYGWSKFAGEQAVGMLGHSALIVRANFFTRFCAAKITFAEYVIRSARGRMPFKCFSDVTSTPVFASTLAAAITEAVVVERFGFMHVASVDSVNRVEQARMICEAYGLSADGIEPVQCPSGESDGRLVNDAPIVTSVRAEIEKMARAEPLEASP